MLHQRGAPSLLNISGSTTDFIQVQPISEMDKMFFISLSLLEIRGKALSPGHFPWRWYQKLFLLPNIKYLTFTSNMKSFIWQLTLNTFTIHRVPTAQGKWPQQFSVRENTGNLEILPKHSEFGLLKLYIPLLVLLLRASGLLQYTLTWWSCAFR